MRRHPHPRSRLTTTLPWARPVSSRWKALCTSSLSNLKTLSIGTSKLPFSMSCRTGAMLETSAVRLMQW